jgi:hypothetical protein
VAPSASSPLVTEWPASEKAHLESLSAGSAVAVEYSGCELHIVDACKPAGRYAWRRTTLATDTVEVTSTDELWAKLPLGAASLEGELGRSGRLAVQTTVAGQLSLEGLDASAMASGAGCARVTHVVTGISVGAFSLYSGGSATGGGAVGVAGIGAGARQSVAERVVRSAGDPKRCAESEQSAPHPQCASPIQVFLQPVAAQGREATSPKPPGAPGAPAPAAVPSGAGVEIAFPAPDDSGEHWSLRDAEGVRVCDLPCTRSVPRSGGWYVERAPFGGKDLARLDLPPRLPFEPGSRAVASYRADRGSPFLSKLTFYGLGIPTAAMSMVALGLGISASRSTDSHDRDRASFWYTASGVYFGTAVASIWWFVWSHDARLELRPQGQASSAAPSFFVAPGWVHGTF